MTTARQATQSTSQPTLTRAQVARRVAEAILQGWDENMPHEQFPAKISIHVGANYSDIRIHWPEPVTRVK